MVEGLNNVNYTLVDYSEHPLFTNITVRVNIIYLKTYLETIGFVDVMNSTTGRNGSAIEKYHNSLDGVNPITPGYDGTSNYT